MSEDQEVAPAPRGRRNWEVIATEFIAGIPKDDNPEEVWFPTMKDLADRHGVKHQTVRARASKERWNDRKDAHAIQVIREKQRKRTRKLAEHAVDFDEKAHKVADIGVNLIMTRLGEIAQEIGKRRTIRERALASIEAGLPVDKQDLYSAVNYREMEALASAAARFQEIGMKALGTDVNRHEISGPDGGALDISATVKVTEEITRDDPERVAAMLAALADAGLLQDGVVEQITGEIIVDEEDIEETGS